jgi:hypothetical protein
LVSSYADAKPAIPAPKMTTLVPFPEPAGCSTIAAAEAVTGSKPKDCIMVKAAPYPPARPTCIRKSRLLKPISKPFSARLKNLASNGPYSIAPAIYDRNVPEKYFYRWIISATPRRPTGLVKGSRQGGRIGVFREGFATQTYTPQGCGERFAAKSLPGVLLTAPAALAGQKGTRRVTSYRYGIPQKLATSHEEKRIRLARDGAQNKLSVFNLEAVTTETATRKAKPKGEH